jgi:hypothetical protein
MPYLVERAAGKKGEEEEDVSKIRLRDETILRSAHFHRNRNVRTFRHAAPDFVVSSVHAKAIHQTCTSQTRS